MTASDSDPRRLAAVEASLAAVERAGPPGDDTTLAALCREVRGALAR